MSKDIREMIDKVKNFNQSLSENNEPQFNVFERKYKYSNYKEILFTGSYDDCVRSILTNPHLELELEEIKPKNLNENKKIISGKNVAIIGSRDFHNYSYAKTQILKIINENKITVAKIISGGAGGADKVGETFANKFNIPTMILEADWSKGKYAGVVRNTDIITESDYVIAFWDGKSKGTVDSINKAKKMNKKLFIVRIDESMINDGVSVGAGENEYNFDFTKDEKTDILTLTYNKNLVHSKVTNGVQSYFSYRTNKQMDSKERTKLLLHIKNKSIDPQTYENLLNKAVTGLFNNPSFDVSDTDLILIPESSSTLNLDIATRIKNKIPNAMFMKDIILKNEPQNVTLNYELLKQKNYDQNTIVSLEGMIVKATIDGVFKIKKIHPRFRKFLVNFLIIDTNNRTLLNRLVDGKIIVVDDYTSEGTTFSEVNRLMDNYGPKEVLLYTLIA